MIYLPCEYQLSDVMCPVCGCTDALMRVWNYRGEAPADYEVAFACGHQVHAVPETGECEIQDCWVRPMTQIGRLRRELASEYQQRLIAQRAGELIGDCSQVGCLKNHYWGGERHNADMDCSAENGWTYTDSELDACPICYLAQAYAIAADEYERGLLA